MLSRVAACTPCLLLSLPSAVRRAASPQLSGENEGWRPREDWALLDGIEGFTVGEGDHVATFWDELAASSIDLFEKSPSECADRLAVISPHARKHGPQPRRLDEWRRLPDGRILGVERNGNTVTVTVSEEGRLAGGSRPMYIESTKGRVYELATSSDSATAAETSKPLPLPGPWRGQQLAAFGALALALVGELAVHQGLLADLFQLLNADSISAADVQAEVALALNSAWLETMEAALSSAVDVQKEIVSAMSMATTMLP